MFETVKWTKGSSMSFDVDGNVLIVDASSIVKKENGLSVHNDILYLEMGEVLWDFMGDL